MGNQGPPCRSELATGTMTGNTTVIVPVANDWKPCFSVRGPSQLELTQGSIQLRNQETLRQHTGR